MNYDEAALYNRAFYEMIKLQKKHKVYVHDLDSFVVGTHNCLTIPFDKLMRPKRITGYLTSNWETQIQ